MRKIVGVGCFLMLSSCAYNYGVGVPLNSSPNEVSTLKASFNFDISSIDDVPFKEKTNISAVGTNTIFLPPGEHSVVFKYCQCSLNSRLWLNETLVYKFKSEIGKTYELKEKFEKTKNIFVTPKISFEIVEIENEPLKKRKS